MTQSGDAPLIAASGGDDPCPEREIYMIYRKDCKLTEQEQQFISFVRRQSDVTAEKE